jgi:hypothetical protein
MNLKPDVLKRLIQSIANAHENELNCDTCFEKIDTFAELTLAGKPAKEALPLVQEHLAHCHDCQEEFEALLAALKAIELDDSPG